MAYEFQSQVPASATVYRPGTADRFKIAGINGTSTNANNFHTAITGMLAVVGLSTTTMERTITQDVEESP